MIRPWTAEEDDYLRSHCKSMLKAHMGAELGRSYGSVKRRMHVLGLRKGDRFKWTDESDSVLQKYYQSKGAQWCAKRIGCSISTAYSRAQALQLTTPMVCVSTADVIDYLRKYHPLGYTDAEIKQVIDRECGVNIDRHRLGDIRKSLGLPSNVWSARQRERVSRKTREQLDKAGLRHLGELKLKSFEAWKRSLGWPESLTMRAVQALELMYQKGPMTRVELCVAMGIDPRRSRTEPKSNAKGGTVMAELMRAGLIGRIHKAIEIPGNLRVHGEPIKGSCKRKHIDLYFLNPGVKPDDNLRTWKPGPAKPADRHDRKAERETQRSAVRHSQHAG